MWWYRKRVIKYPVLTVPFCLNQDYFICSFYTSRLKKVSSPCTHLLFHPDLTLSFDNPTDPVLRRLLQSLYTPGSSNLSYLTVHLSSGSFWVKKNSRFLLKSFFLVLLSSFITIMHLLSAALLFIFPLSVSARRRVRCSPPHSLVLWCLALNHVPSVSGRVGIESSGSWTESNAESNYIHLEILQHRGRSFFVLIPCKSMTCSSLVPKRQDTALP